jgi:hypothetical protein
VRFNHCSVSSSGERRVTFGIALFSVHHARVADNEVANIAKTKHPVDRASGYGILLYRKDPSHLTGHNEVRRNRVRHTAGSGIYLAGSHLTVVADNEVEDVASDAKQQNKAIPVGGIATSGTDSEILRNRVRGSAMAGVVFTASGATVSDNDIARTQSYGIHARGVGLTSSEIARNKLEDVGSGGVAGIFIEEDLHLSVADNTVERAGQYGIELKGDGHAVTGNTIVDPGEAGSGRSTGIVVRATACRVAGNRVYYSAPNLSCPPYPIEERAPARGNTFANTVCNQACDCVHLLAGSQSTVIP